MDIFSRTCLGIRHHGGREGKEGEEKDILFLLQCIFCDVAPEKVASNVFDKRLIRFLSVKPRKYTLIHFRSRQVAASAASARTAPSRSRAAASSPRSSSPRSSAGTTSTATGSGRRGAWPRATAAYPRSSELARYGGCNGEGKGVFRN